MPRWTPEKTWDGRDCIIIGGGASLRTFDWSKLKNENTIGCNTAFIHGPEISKLCIFGDYTWWTKFQFDLSKYAEKGGIVFTNSPALLKTKLSWLWTMPRETKGLHTEALGWNGNTGALAINLALLLGVAKIYLIGFDMHLVDNKSNWHDKIMNPNLVLPSVYPKFCKEFKWVQSDWKKKFPNVEIFNITNDSGLSSDLIPWMSPRVFWESRNPLGI